MNFSKLTELLIVLLKSKITIPASVTIFFVYWINTFQNALIQHIQITMVFLSITFSLSIYFGFILWRNSQKKLINRILVDRKGECFCHKCFSLLKIIHNSHNYPKLDSIFSCDDCKLYRDPCLNNGKQISATFFYSFQQANPQTLITHELIKQYEKDTKPNQPVYL